ncbi:hypothetical protein F5Y16DRAFT_285787 [Xylariaceae sp. FL0255]|nr:hypothetical protein F5Y16DRAFT_285787 [Xylariaceae sp. FL0255]
MGFRRAKRPAPMPLENSTSPRQPSFASESSDKPKVSHIPAVDKSEYFADYTDIKSLNRSSTAGTVGSAKRSPTANVYTHCGRHTDQYLFGGRSMSDLWRSLKKN